MAKTPLPIDPYLSEIVKIVASGRDLILKASPGSGKTTRVPPALLAAEFIGDKEILVLVPRRLAAKMAALRVASEAGEAVGSRIGYQFRFENVTSPKTRLKFLTEGLLIRQLMSDPKLTRVGSVILDEFHERHLHSDVALAYLKWLKKNHRPDLSLIVMSATLDTASLAAYLHGCETLDIKASPYPVSVSYLPQPTKEPLPDLVWNAVRSLPFKDQSARQDVLVFLPGMADILKTADKLESRLGPRFLVLPLHGELAKERQALVFEKTPEIKIILATNVAESSLTIDGVTTVIDSGLHRQASYSWWSGVPSLKTRPVSKASAIQRAGRAGRTAPGRCLRLYTQADFEARTPFETPEIRRADLAETLLEIKALGVADMAAFPWFEAPAEQATTAAAELLYNLGALAAPSLSAGLTILGESLAKLPLNPRLSRLMIEAEKKSVTREAALLAALISEDELADLDALAHLGARFVPENVKRVKNQILSYFRTDENISRDVTRDLAYALLKGFPDRVARKRSATQSKKSEARALEEDLVFCFGGSGSVSAVDVVNDNEYFLILDVLERQARGQARAKVHVQSLCPIKADWLLDCETTFLKDVEELAWDEAKKRVVQASRLCYGQLILTESKDEPRDAASATKFLLKTALGLDEEKFANLSVVDFLKALEKTSETTGLETLLGRLALLKEHFPAAELPDIAHDRVGEALADLLRGSVALADLKSENLEKRLVENLNYETRALMARELPLAVTLKSGRNVAVKYELGKSPWIASRLQDFFGMREGPKILKGRVPLTLHLLAPNQRAVQVTSDLASFWQGTYLEIRGQLSRRYPRHKWPEDPLVMMS